MTLRFVEAPVATTGAVSVAGWKALQSILVRHFSSSFETFAVLRVLSFEARQCARDHGRNVASRRRSRQPEQEAQEQPSLTGTLYKKTSVDPGGNPVLVDPHV